MEIAGVVKRVAMVRSGEGVNGMWVSREFSIMTTGDYSREVAFVCVGKDMVNIISGINEGKTVIVRFVPESRMKKDETGWWTSLRCVAIQVAEKIAINN
ncbi:MAG: DUF3127 domain-containing protein [Bacteroidota bacterium]|nr:DUF3127 domain-containing protein [Bacteroidota bacterium]